jgi:MFS transporter, FSR family, fosmidomycin resistance protein
VASVNPALPPEPAPRVDYPRVALLSAGHLINDVYGSLMTSLTPYLIVRGVIGTTQAGFVLLVYLIGSSAMQPLFGVVTDRSSRRIFAIAGPLWVGIAAASFAWGGNGLLLLLIASIGGVGTAAFHPQAATMVNGLAGRQKGWVMSIFSMGGNLGFAFGPIVAATLAMIGLRWSPVILIPGLVMCGLLMAYAPTARQSMQTASIRELATTFRAAGKSLFLIVGVIAIRSGTQMSLIIFLPLYFHARGFPVELGSYYAFVLSLSGAIGGLLGGRISDRYGRKQVVVVSLLMSAPLLAFALGSGGIMIWPALALSGMALLASGSVTVVQGQELLPGSTGVASGLTLGLGFGLSGLITSGLTAFSGHLGVTHIVEFIPVLPLFAAALGFLVPVRKGRAPLHANSPMEAIAR